MVATIGVHIVLADDVGILAIRPARLRNNFITSTREVEPANITFGQNSAECLADIPHRYPHRLGALTVNGNFDFRLAEIKVAFNEDKLARFAGLGENLLHYTVETIVALLCLDNKFDCCIATGAW